MPATLSAHFQNRSPSAIRQAQILFAERPDRADVEVINAAIGNITLPMHPAMRKRMKQLGHEGPFAEGVVKYSSSVGEEETRTAFLRGIEVCGALTNNLFALVTDGGSMSMELMVLGICGPQAERPLLVLDPVYTNYVELAARGAVRTVAYRRTLQDDGLFSLPNLEEIERLIQEHNPAGILIIPNDNPTGQCLAHDDIVDFAKICVAHDLWLISDEAYRQLAYGNAPATSVWNVTEAMVPGIDGRRISIESASKVWNACGLRVGALVTDNEAFHRRAVAEHTANLCSNVLGQYIFGALAHESDAALEQWFREQRTYYSAMMTKVRAELQNEVPGLIISQPQAAVYAVIDVRNVEGVQPNFDAGLFVAYCAQKGRVRADGVDMTLLVSPMAGFYASRKSGDNIGNTQMRVAFVEPAHKMNKIARVFSELLRRYLQI